MQHYMRSAEISGLQVRVLPGSPLKLKHLQENRGKLENATVAETVAGVTFVLAVLL